MADQRKIPDAEPPTSTDEQPGERPRPVLALLRRPGVLMGAVATTMIALGSLIPENAVLFRLPGWLTFLRELMLLGTGIAFIVIGGVLLAAAWLELRPRPGDDELRPFRRMLVISTIWSLPLLFALPVASTDAYLYLDQGWQVTQGLDPYVVGLTEAGGPMAPYVSWVWAGTTAVYPPLALEYSALAVRLGFSQPYLSLVALHALSLVMLWLGGWAVRRLAVDLGRDPHKALWWYLNPVIVLSGVGGMHHELLMTTLTLLGLAVARTRLGLIGGTVLVGIAATVKQPAIFIMPALIVATLPAAVAQARGARMWVELAIRTVVAGVVGFVVFAGVSLALGFGFGWMNALWLPGRVFTLAPRTVLWEWLVRIFGDLGRPLPEGTYNVITLAVTGLAVLWLLVAVLRLTPDRWTTLAWVGPLAYSLAAPSLWPWYLIPVVVVFGLELLDERGVRRRLAFVLGLAVFQVLIENTGFAMYGALAAGLIVAVLWLQLARRYPAIPRELADDKPPVIAA